MYSNIISVTGIFNHCIKYHNMKERTAHNSSDTMVKGFGEIIREIYEGYEMLSRWTPEFTAKEFLVILAMRDDRTYKVSEIAESLDFPMSTTSFLINSLVTKNILTRKRGRVDRRIVQVRLTDLGKMALSEYDLIFERIASQMLSELDKDESKELMRLLRKIGPGISQKK